MTGASADSLAFARISAVLKRQSGLHLGEDKLYLLQTRLLPLMRQAGVGSLAAFCARLEADEALARDAAEAMTTNESLFFRDSKPFEALRLRILPRLAASRPGGTPLRIWSAAASTGQEAYSIAMLLQDVPLGGRPVEILGTDLSREALARAEAGLYSQFEVQRGLPMQALVRHFTKQGAAWQLRPELRAMVCFRQWNLLHDPAVLGRFDVIFCRNVLIYFDEPTKSRVLGALARQLAPDGVLFLGGAETLVGLQVPLVPCGEAGGYQPAPAALARVA